MAENILLTLDEACKLENISYSAIYKKIIRGYLKHEKIKTCKGRGFEYRINLLDLSESAKVKYYVSQKEKNIDTIIDIVNISSKGYKEIQENKEETNIYRWEKLSDSQKEKAYLWEAIIKAWRTYVDDFNGKETDATKEFIKSYNKKSEIKVSQRTLYRKWTAYKDNGIVALADFRGNKNNTGNEIADEVWNIFQDWYLDINKPKVAFLYKALTYHFEMENPDLLPLPSESTFRRAIDSRIPKSVVTYFREGKKVWTDECAYYLRRDYSTLNSNDIWTSDYHTLDLFVKDDFNYEIYRPHLIIWSDIKSRKVLSMSLRRSSDSHGVFLSFRNAVIKYGAPEMVYFDNGREFLASDIGGRGRRKTDINADYGKTLFERLGIRMINAKVANGRAKIAERQFNTMANQFSRMFETYCGNRPGNRPEGHVDRLKDEKNIPLLSEVENELKNYIEGYYNNVSSNAEGLEKGSPNAAYEKHLMKIRTIAKAQLDELLLRTTRLQTYKRNGVYVTIGNTKVYFYNSDITINYLDKKVYVRYNPDDLSEVIIEDEQGRYVGKAAREITGGYGLANDTDSIKHLNKTNKMLEKIARDYKKVEDMASIPSVREVISKKSQEMMEENVQRYYAKIIEPILNDSEYKKAVGAENMSAEIVDFDRMIENANKNRNKED